jgi:hypothetical protein
MKKSQMMLLSGLIVGLMLVSQLPAAFESAGLEHEGKTGLKDLVRLINANFTKLAGATETLSVSKITSVTNIATTATVSGTLGVTGLATFNNIAVNTNATVSGTANIATLNVTGAKGVPSNVAGLITNGVASMAADATWIPVQHGGTNYWVPAFLK